MQCPHCGHQFLPGLEVEEPEPVSEEPAASAAREDELSELRIRNISNLRRGAYRGRSLLIIAAAVCIVAAAKFIQITVVAVQSHLYLAAVGDALCALAATIATVMVVPKIAVLTREIRSSRLRRPTEPPDFSQLGDGSQRWKNLDQLSQKHDSQ
jgi:hypothetical protein